MLSPEGIAAFSSSAALHVQVRVERITRDGDSSSGEPNARITGTIVRVFRGEARWLGAQAEVDFPPVEAGEGTSHEGLSQHQQALVERLRLIEAFLSPSDMEPRRLNVVIGLWRAIESPSDQPQLDEYGLFATDATDAQRPRGPTRRAVQSFPWRLLLGIMAVIALCATLVGSLGSQ